MILRARRRCAPFCRDDWNFDEAQRSCRYPARRRNGVAADRKLPGIIVGLAATSSRASCSSPLAGTKADGAAYAADAARRGAAAIVAGKGAQSAALTVPVLAVADPRLALALTRGALFRPASRRPWSPSPAPAARPRSPPSRGRSGSRPATRRPASARPASSRPAATNMAR